MVKLWYSYKKSIYEGKCRIINNREDEDLRMQKSMKLRCRIKFIEPKVLLDKLKEISVKILAKKSTVVFTKYF